MVEIVPQSDAPELGFRSPLHRAARNFGKLLSGRSVAALLELLTIGLLARTLSPAHLGQIVLIQTYALVIRGLFNFKLHDVLIQFGVPLLEAKDECSFKQLLKITLLIDFLSCAIATVVAVSAASFVGKILGWEDRLTMMAMLYSSILLTYAFGTLKGVLRIFNRFDLLVKQLMVGPVLRLMGTIVVMMLAPSVLLFVVALAIATAAGNLYMIASGWAELRRQAVVVSLKGSSLGKWRKEFPRLRQFVGIVYWQANVDMLPKHISILLAGTFLGPAGAGFLRLANELTKILSKPGALLWQVLFPDLVRMWARGAADFRAMLLRAILICALSGLVFTLVSVFAGSYLLTIGLGADYAKATPLLSLLLLATTLELMSTVLRAAGYAMSHAGKILRIHLISAVLYLMTFVVLTPLLGLIGPGIAACTSAVVAFTSISWLVGQSIRNAPRGEIQACKADEV